MSPSESRLKDPRARDLVQAVQTGFPVTPRPYTAVAERLGWSETEVIDTLETLIEDGVIRSLGPVFEPARLGYTSTLVAAEVEADRIAELAAVMLDIREITHNYHRDHALSVWFTIIALTEKLHRDIITRVNSFPGVRRVLDLPVETMYKLRVLFDVPDETAPVQLSPPATPPTPVERNVVRALQNGLSLFERPFAVAADIAGIPEDDLLATVRAWLEDGTIRRFGARVNHHQLGFDTNVLAVWDIPDPDAAGPRFAKIPAVSHCYRRRPHPTWPYTLYTMVHARTEAEIAALLSGMTRIAGASPLLLRTLYELKKTGMKYFLEDESWDTIA